MLNPMKFFQKQKAKLSVSKESVKKCCRCICKKATGFYDFLTKDGLNGRSFYNWKNLNTMVRQKGRTIMEMIAVILIIGLLTLGAIFLYRLSINHHHANQIVDDVERLAFTVHEKVQDIDKSDYAIDFAKRGIDFRKNSMYDIKAYKKSTDSFYIEVPGVLYSECVVLLPKAQEEAVSAFPENEDRPDRYIISVITKDKNGKYNEQFFESGSSPKEICKAPTIQSSSEQTLTVRFYFAVQVGGDCEPCDPAQATKCCNGCFCDTSANYCATDVRSSFRPEKCCPKGTVACGGRCVSNSCPADKPFSEEKCMCDIKGNTVCIENMVEHCEEYNTAATSANCPCTRCETGYIEDNGVCTLVECNNDPSETPVKGNEGLLGKKSLCNEYEAICNDQGVHPCKEWTCVVPSFIPSTTAPEYKYYMIDKTAVYGEKGRPCPWKCASGYELASPTQCVPPLYPCVPPTTLNDCCILHDSKGDIVYGANGKPIDTYDRTARYRTQGVDCPCVSCRGSLSDCSCSLPKNYDSSMVCDRNKKCIETCPCEVQCEKPPFAENPCKTGWDGKKCDFTGDCGEYARPIDGQCKRPCTSRAPSDGSPWSVTVNGKSATCRADTMVYTSRTTESEACPADPGYCPCTQFLCTSNASTCAQPSGSDMEADPGRNWHSVTSSASAPCERCLCKTGYKEDTTAAGCTAAGTCGKCVCTDVTHLNGAGCVEYNTHYTGAVQCPCTKWACVTDKTTCKLPTPEDKASDGNR
ncbi:MAG: hypothetical protein J6P93_00390, partial [Alphaproteobacteria bacterium]|nr:hypothetical protein [Alphaproteobacteria bacterium]